jgi:hypothetical protein
MLNPTHRAKMSIAWFSRNVSARIESRGFKLLKLEAESGNKLARKRVLADAAAADVHLGSRGSVTAQSCT